MRKFIYAYIVQANYGYGYEDIEKIDKHEKYHGYTPEQYARYLKHEHWLNQKSASYRIISRRIVNEQYTAFFAMLNKEATVLQYDNTRIKYLPHAGILSQVNKNTFMITSRQNFTYTFKLNNVQSFVSGVINVNMLECSMP